MNFAKPVLVLFLSLLLLPSAFARKPAVEDFVGVEPESFSRTPQGTEVLFDFGNTVQAFQPETESSLSAFWKEWTPALVLASFIMLPFGMWFAITRSANKAQIAAESAENVAKLADYMKDEAKTESKDQADRDKDEDFKQAS